MATKKRRERAGRPRERRTKQESTGAGGTREEPKVPREGTQTKEKVGKVLPTATAASGSIELLNPFPFSCRPPLPLGGGDPFTHLLTSNGGNRFKKGKERSKAFGAGKGALHDCILCILHIKIIIH